MAPRKQRKSYSTVSTSAISRSLTTEYTKVIGKTIPQLYGKIQEDGAIRQKWLEDPKDPTCTIKPTTLTIKKLKKQGWIFRTNIIHTPCEIKTEFTNQGTLKYEEFRDILLTKPCADSERNFHWILLGNGIIYVKDINRHDGPPFSEIATTLYKAGAPMESLKHVYFDNVVNLNTKRFVVNRLYTEKGLDFLAPRRPIMVWRYDTPEYQGLLGTRLGKAVAYMVLGAFSRGTHYISQVVSFAGPAYPKTIMSNS
ncbi:hypothetical protein PENANT_c012G09060 [Penicillium antarcticum]|uniref:Uncharacterized protein n=1 Tax=Penicillium antarcticum TaxID=416450 RepID=A0A1V6Q5Y1_9EURO|nr:hypothetical protein PENANT_c012G09060 [Penicillium antarcticum]